MVKLNLGSHGVTFEGWVNVDLVEYGGVNLVQDVRRLLQFESDTVDLIYAGHVLEHFYYDEALDALREWVRVLKPGGVMKVAVPGLELVVEKMLNCESPLEQPIQAMLYGGRGRWETYREDDELSRHHYSWTKYKLSQTLKEVGLVNVREWEWPDLLSELEGKASACQSPISLNLQGEKPVV